MTRRSSVSPLAYEHGLAAAGYDTVAGIDEVGRGALAGPIVAAAVVLPRCFDLDTQPWAHVRDSKTLSPSMRALLASVILEQSHGCAIAEIDAALIDQIGIGAANRLVMEFALRDLEQRLQPNFLLIDAMTIDSGIPQIGIIDGDAISLSIAAASIVAKVHRDTIMTTLSPRWPDYGWDANKGYGVRKHVEAITRVGPCVHHRLSFRPMCDLTHVQHA